MKRLHKHPYTVGVLIALLTLLFGFARPAEAHCDRVNGPVAVAAQEALRTGELMPVLIWVGEEQEKELETAFKRSRKAYHNDAASRELAERYFMESAVRLHRQAEGMPYTGLKPAAPPSKDIRVAEEALETGTLMEVTDLLAEEMRQKSQELYAEALQARKRKGDGLQAGRRWADAYVRYIVYIHTLHQQIQAGPAHGVGDHSQ